jgi:hypothetical protein
MKFATSATGSYYEGTHIGQPAMQLGTEDSLSVNKQGKGSSGLVRMQRKSEPMTQ